MGHNKAVLVGIFFIVVALSGSFTFARGANPPCDPTDFCEEANTFCNSYKFCECTPDYIRDPSKGYICTFSPVKPECRSAEECGAFSICADNKCVCSPGWEKSPDGVCELA